MTAGAEELSPASSLPGFLVLYAALYAGLGAASPFLPAFLESRGITYDQIGLLFAAGTAVRLVSAPIAGRLADRTQALRLALSVCAIGTALAVLGYLPPWGFSAVLAVTLAHAFAVAPTTNLADALALVTSSRAGNGFEYGWVRGAGSLAFVLGSLLAGSAIVAHGLAAIVWLQAVFLLAVPFAALLVPPTAPATKAEGRASRAGLTALLRVPIFRRVVLVAALIMGSHAMHDTFSVIRWSGAGISPRAISVLWSISVLAEVAVFLRVGPWLLRALSPAGTIALAAVAGAVRWLVVAVTADVAALSLTQLLHGVTFALLHLACMRLLQAHVPPRLAATAQAVYGTVGIGAATALLTLVSGWLYARWGAHAFVAMALLCLAALPVARGLPGGSGGARRAGS